MEIQLFKRFQKYKKIFSIDENSREINIYKFDNCIATGHNLYYPNVLLKTNDKLILPLLERTMSLLKIGTIYEKKNMNYEPVENNSNAIQSIQFCNIPLFFFVYNTDNYFHFLYDTLPYLISYIELKRDIPELKLLMQLPNEQRTEFYTFVLEFLEILNINQEDIILIKENMLYKEIYVSTSYTHDIDSNLPPRNEIYTFYNNIVDNVKLQYPHFVDIMTPPKIYVSRRTWLHNDISNIGTNYTMRRRLVNEDVIVEKLVIDGYKEVFTERLSTVEKILYFANATHVVGAISGGITNVLFSPKTTKLEAFISPTFLDVNKRVRYSLDGVDVKYNMNSRHVDKGEFKTYMRVKTKDGKIVGEIERIYDNKLLVSYTDGSNTGWNSQNIYKKIELSMMDVEKLDDGLNSPWEIY